jgi:hypothetical protein
MSEPMLDVDWFGDPAAEEAAQEVAPEEPVDPEEPETLEDEVVPIDTGEANVADVVAQLQEVGLDDDGYEREE